MAHEARQALRSVRRASPGTGKRSLSRAPSGKMPRRIWWGAVWVHLKPSSLSAGSLLMKMVGFFQSVPYLQQCSVTRETPGRASSACIGGKSLIIDEAGFSKEKWMPAVVQASAVSMARRQKYVGAVLHDLRTVAHQIGDAPGELLRPDTR